MSPGDRPANDASRLADASKGSAAMEPRMQINGGTPLVASTTAGRNHQQFLDRLKHQSAQSVVNEVRDFVTCFTADLSRRQAARRIHDFVSDVTPRLTQTKAFADLSADEATEVAMEGIEKFVVLKLHKLLFRHSPADLREDEHVESCIRAASSSSSLPAGLSAQALKTFEEAVVELQQLDQYRAPRDKAVCMLNAYRLVEGILVEEAFNKGSAKDNDADEEGGLLRRLLVALITRSASPNFYSNVEFVQAFRHPSRVTAEEQQSFRELSAALAAVIGSARSARGGAADGGAGSDVGEALGADAGGPLPDWLVDAGVTFHFEGHSAGDLKVGDLDELFDGYRKMARALRELAGVAEPESRNLGVASPHRMRGLRST